MFGLLQYSQFIRNLTENLGIVLLLGYFIYLFSKYLTRRDWCNNERFENNDHINYLHCQLQYVQVLSVQIL
jgi:hypothetical protein